MKNIVTLLAITGMLFMISCDKEKDEEKEEKTDVEKIVNTIREYATVNKLFDDVSNSADDALMNAESSLKSAKTSPVITVDPLDFITFPKTITIDFGSGITGLDGVTRKGKVIVISTNWHDETGSIHTATFDNYYENNNKIEGTHVATNLGPVDSISNPRFKIDVIDGKITTQEGKVIHFTQESYRTLVAGDDTKFNVWDNEYKIEGTQSGISSDSVEYSIEITEPLYFKVVPRGFYAGIALVDIGTFQDIEINYNTSTITIFNQEYPLFQ